MPYLGDVKAGKAELSRLVNGVDEEVEYWKELTEIMDWSKTHVHSCLLYTSTLVYTRAFLVSHAVYFPTKFRSLTPGATIARDRLNESVPLA